MKPTPFNLDTDLPPLPFDPRHCQLAAELKKAGLPWAPHVGCFVWDRDCHIEASSPFPHRIYFILNVGRFLQIFSSRAEVAEKLIWLPTEHQARLLCARFGVVQKTETTGEVSPEHCAPGDILLALYRLLLDTLRAPAPCEGSA